MRRKIVAGNWKMNTEIPDAIELAGEIRKLSGEITEPVVVLCPSAPMLASVSEVVKNSEIKVGGQNMHYESSGAFTGEVSAAMLLSVGCKYVILGHSERRTIFGEDDAFVNKKMHAALNTGLTPILCIGETLEEREAEKTLDVIKKQVIESLKNIEISSGYGIVVAYEPVWAIGTGLTATPVQAEDVHAYIRGLLSEIFGKEKANDITIQYGGSMKPDNAVELMAQPNIDGGLIGGAALKAESFAAIIEAGRA